MTNAAPSAPNETDRWEIADQWRQAWRGLKWTAAGLITIAALMAVGQIYLFQQLFSEIHPALGWGFVISATGLAARFVGWPLSLIHI